MKQSLLLFLLAILVSQGFGFWPFSSNDGELPVRSQHENENFQIHQGQKLSLSLQKNALSNAEGEKILQEFETSNDICLLENFLNLKVSCQEQDDEKRSMLAIRWMNCVRKRTDRSELYCEKYSKVKDCTKDMGEIEFTQFNMYYLKISDVCLALNNEVTRARV